MAVGMESTIIAGFRTLLAFVVFFYGINVVGILLMREVQD